MSILRSRERKARVGPPPPGDDACRQQLLVADALAWPPLSGSAAGAAPRPGATVAALLGRATLGGAGFRLARFPRTRRLNQLHHVAAAPVSTPS